MFVITVGGGLEPSKGVSCLRPNLVLTMDEQERDDERPRSMFYRSPTMGAKCTYQNSELAHVRVDTTKVGSRTSHVGFERHLC